MFRLLAIFAVLLAPGFIAGCSEPTTKPSYKAPAPIVAANPKEEKSSKKGWMLFGGITVGGVTGFVGFRRFC